MLWGLDSWPGIHEPAYSRLAYSNDFAETWKHLEFDTHEFFPYKFYSLPGKAIQILTYSGIISQMQDRVGKRWKPVKNVAELDNLVNDTIPGDSYFSGGRFKFLETGQLLYRMEAGWKSIVNVGFINEISDVCSCAGSTYLAGSNNSVFPTPEYLLRVRRGQVLDTMILPSGTRYIEQKHLRCDNKGRLWLYNFRGIWQKSGSKLLKRY